MKRNTFYYRNQWNQMQFFTFRTASRCNRVLASQLVTERPFPFLIFSPSPTFWPLELHHKRWWLKSANTKWDTPSRTSCIISTLLFACMGWPHLFVVCHYMLLENSIKICKKKNGNVKHKSVIKMKHQHQQHQHQHKLNSYGLLYSYWVMIEMFFFPCGFYEQKYPNLLKWH